MAKRPRERIRALVVPLVLSVAVVATATAVATSPACGPHNPPPPDATPDVPIPTYQAYGHTVALTDADIDKLPEGNRRRVLTFRRIAEIAEGASRPTAEEDPDEYPGQRPHRS